jgi:hypothetical protein
MSASSYPEMVSLVYWWDIEGNRWAEVTWAAWAASSGINSPAKPLLGIRPGDTHFVVCVVDDDGSMANIIPHRYLIDAEGYRRHGDEPITEDENKFEREYYLKRETTEFENERHTEINQKIYRWSLPPAEAAQKLLRTLPSPPSMNLKHGIRHFMAACGVSMLSTRLQ